MKKKMNAIGIGVLTTFLMLAFSQLSIAKSPPVAKLVQVEGMVEYSRNGTRWTRVKRTKYLFAGYQIRTGDDSGGKLINQTDGTAQQLGSDSHIKVLADSVSLVSGNLTEPQSESGSIFQSLANKFAKAQRYTTVRRSINDGEEQGCDNKVRTIKSLTLSPSYPDLVWRNACPEFFYRVVIDGVATDIAAQSTSEMIRFPVSSDNAGEHTYRVEVMDKDGTVYIPRKDSSFTLITAKDEKAVKEALNGYEDDVFEQTNYLESQGMYVAAMDLYREYFIENPDDNDMRPLLIQSYNDLKLTNLKKSEARLYNAALEEDY